MLIEENYDGPANVERALSLFEQGVEAWDLQAVHHLAYLYFEGEYVEQNIDRAIELYEIALQF